MRLSASWRLIYGVRAYRGLPRLIPIAIGLVLSTIATLTNLGLRKEFVGYDAGVSLLRPQSNAAQLHIWNPVFAPGSYSPLNLFAAPWVLTSQFLNHLGATPVLIQRLYYGLLIFTAFVGAYLLVELVTTRLLAFSPSPQVMVAAAVGASWYAFNPYSMLLMTFPSTPHELAWSLLPLGLAMIVNGMTRTSSLTWIALTAGVWATIASGNVALTVVALVTASVVSGIFLAEVDRRFRMRAIRFLGGVAVLTLALACFFWLPLVTGGNPVAASGRIDDQSMNFVASAQFSSLRTSLLNLVRLDGSIAMPDQTYFPLLNSLGPLAASIALALGAGLVLLVPPTRHRRALLWIAAMGGAFLFLAKGEHDPLGGPMTWIYTHVGLAGAFRNSYDKFLLPVMIAESIMLAFFLLWLGSQQRLASRLGVGTILLAAAVYPGIFLAGKVADDRYLVSVPAEYQRLEAYLSAAGRPTIFSGPDFGGRAYYNWYQGNFTPDPVLLSVPTITEQWLRSEGLASRAADDRSYTRAIGAAFDVLPELGAGYILIHHDFLPSIQTGGFASPRELVTNGPSHAMLMETTAAARSDMRLVLSNSYFSLYQYCRAAVKPELYATSTVESVDQTSAASKGRGCRIVGPAKYDSTVGTAVQSGVDQVNVLQASAEAFRVHAQATTPSTLVLSQTYDDNWGAVLEGSGTAATQPLAHIVVNRYLNGWLLPRTGEYNVAIRYRPLDAVQFAEIVSLFGLVATAAMIAIDVVRRTIGIRIPRRHLIGSPPVKNRTRAESSATEPVPVKRSADPTSEGKPSRNLGQDNS
jgi:hypothetical protein